MNKNYRFVLLILSHPKKLTRLNLLCRLRSATVRHNFVHIHKIVDFDLLIDNSAHLEGENLTQRQINVARARGGVALFITANPESWVYAFNQGIPCAMFGVPAYQRVEFRPDAPKKVRSWDSIVEAVEKQNELMTKDVRLLRTEGLNFE
jgi:hypothetical protein